VSTRHESGSGGTGVGQPLPGGAGAEADGDPPLVGEHGDPDCACTSLGDGRFEVSLGCFCERGFSFGGAVCPPTLPQALAAYPPDCQGDYRLSRCADLIVVGEGGLDGGHFFYDVATEELVGAYASSDQGFRTCDALELSVGQGRDPADDCETCFLCRDDRTLCQRDSQGVPLPPGPQGGADP